MVSLRHVLSGAGLFVAGLGTAMTATTLLVIPAIMHQVSIERTQALRDHSMIPHPGSLSRAEHTLFSASVSQRLDQLLHDVRELSNKVDRLHGN